MKIKILVLISFVVLYSCKKNETSQYGKLKFDSDFNFSTITLKDSIIHKFNLKNISDTQIKISRIETSCGCTAAIVSDSIIKPNNNAVVEVRYKPKESQSAGNIENSIVIEANTEPAFSIIRIKGKVIDTK